MDSQVRPQRQRARGEAQDPDRVLPAPEHLGVENREAFREAAVSLVESMPEGQGRLILDLTNTHYIDTAGLGTLAFIHKKASESRHAVRLRNPNEEVRFSLVLARLEELFELDDLIED